MKDVVYKGFIEVGQQKEAKARRKAEAKALEEKQARLEETKERRKAEAKALEEKQARLEEAKARQAAEAARQTAEAEIARLKALLATKVE